MNNIILTASTLALKGILAEARVTYDCDFIVSYTDVTADTFTEAANDGTFNGLSSAEILAAPAANVTRVINEIIIHNRDTVTHTFSLSIANGAQILWRGTLLTLETFSFDGTYDSQGRRKMV